MPCAHCGTAEITKKYDLCEKCYYTQDIHRAHRLGNCKCPIKLVVASGGSLIKDGTLTVYGSGGGGGAGRTGSLGSTRAGGSMGSGSSGGHSTHVGSAGGANGASIYAPPPNIPDNGSMLVSKSIAEVTGNTMLKCDIGGHSAGQAFVDEINAEFKEDDNAFFKRSLFVPLSVPWEFKSELMGRYEVAKDQDHWHCKLGPRPVPRPEETDDHAIERCKVACHYPDLLTSHDGRRLVEEQDPKIAPARDGTLEVTVISNGRVYGRSILTNAIASFNKMRAIENAATLYRITRSPEDPDHARARHRKDLVDLLTALLNSDIIREEQKPSPGSLPL